MTRQKANLTLPTETTTQFETLAQFGDTDMRDSLIIELRKAGWTLQSIATASQLTRERVRQIAQGDPLYTNVTVPEVPQRAAHAAPVFIEPEPEALARMLELQPLAQKVRSNSPKYREEAEEYTKILADQHLNRKVTLYRLALRLGVTHLALRARLARYGYKTPPNGGKSRVYTPIAEANRIR